EAPRHPYTRSLIEAIPVPVPGARRERRLLEGDPPSPAAPPPGCRFHTRCPFAADVCRVERPALRALSPDHAVACHLADELPAAVSADLAVAGNDPGRRRVSLFAEAQRKAVSVG